MVTWFVETSSTRGSGLKTSYGEIVWCTLSENGKVDRNGLWSGKPGRKLGEDRDSGDSN